MFSYFLYKCRIKWSLTFSIKLFEEQMSNRVSTGPEYQILVYGESEEFICLIQNLKNNLESNQK